MFEIEKELKKKNISFYLIPIVIAGLFFRLIFIYYDEVIVGDGTLYISLAKQLQQGNFVMGSFRIDPLYSSIIAFCSFVFRDFELSALIINILVYLLSVYVLYVLVKRMFNEEISLLTCLLFSLYPFYVDYSRSIMTESLFILFLMLGMFYLYIALEETKHTSSMRSFFISGIFFSLSYLTRSEGMAYALLAVILIVVFSFLKQVGITMLLKNTSMFIIPLVISFLIIALLLTIENNTLTLTSDKVETISLGEKRQDKIANEEYFGKLNENKTDFEFRTHKESLFRFIIENPIQIYERLKTHAHLIITSMLPILFYNHYGWFNYVLLFSLFLIGIITLLINKTVILNSQYKLFFIFYLAISFFLCVFSEYSIS